MIHINAIDLTNDYTKRYTLLVASSMMALRVHEPLDAVGYLVAGASVLILIVAVLIAYAAIVNVERRAFHALGKLT